MLEHATKYQNLLSKRGQEDKPVERLFRIISHPEMLRQAYVNLYANKGALTEGTKAGDSIDGMSFERIEKLSQRLKAGEFKWEPVRRIHIPKSNGKTRPLGIPNWSEKLVQESMRLALSAYYEPKFRDTSHGFRPNRSCHTALNKISNTWTGTKWFIEGDIKGCFDAINHDKLMVIIQRNIHDDRFSKLLKDMLNAGYLENWTYKESFTGTPQGES